MCWVPNTCIKEKLPATAALEGECYHTNSTKSILDISKFTSCSKPVLCQSVVCHLSLPPNTHLCHPLHAICHQSSVTCHLVESLNVPSLSRARISHVICHQTSVTRLRTSITCHVIDLPPGRETESPQPVPR